MSVHFFAVDESNRWYLFDANDALGDFATWDEANALRAKLAGENQTDDAPAWNPKSGGY